MVYQVARIIKPAGANNPQVTLELQDGKQPNLTGGTSPHFYKEAKAREFLMELELTHERETYVIVSW